MGCLLGTDPVAWHRVYTCVQHCTNGTLIRNDDRVSMIMYYGRCSDLRLHVS